MQPTCIVQSRLVRLTIPASTFTSRRTVIPGPNIVEIFFMDLTQNGLRRGVFHNVGELVTAVGNYIAQHNKKPKPFIWTAKAADILEKVKRANAVLLNRQSA